MTMGEPSENLQYFLKLQKQRKMSLFKEKKNPLLPNFISSSFLVCFKQLKSYGNVI